MHVNVLNCKMQKKYKTVDCIKFCGGEFSFVSWHLGTMYSATGFCSLVNFHSSYLYLKINKQTKQIISVGLRDIFLLGAF